MILDKQNKGLAKGDAVISDKHGGFIVNRGRARAVEVLHLVEIIQEKVLHAYGIELEPEVKFVGFQ